MANTIIVKVIYMILPHDFTSQFWNILDAWDNVLVIEKALNSL
jgi:hypothetical protein